MARWVSSEEARRSFGELLDFTAETSQPITVEDDGRRVAVLISPTDFDRLTAHLWETVERIRARNVDQDPDEVLRLVTDAVDEVRQEQHEHGRPLAESRR